VLLHFAVPFGLLLSRETKRSASVLAAIATGVAIVRTLDVFWMIVPAFAERTGRLHWLDPAVFVGLGGIWMFVFLWAVDRREMPTARDERWKTVEGARS
jgi:hypothetical protein